MCGIVGFVGSKNAKNVLISGLKKLEYRGYDSAGIALQNSVGEIKIIKEQGRICDLEKRLDCEQSFDSFCGIGHTRWATHGSANRTNAHPHSSDDGTVAIVHNGIIENHKELKDKLTKKGYNFYSQTDSEVLAKLIHYYLIKYKTPMEALPRVCLRVVGSFAVCILFSCEPQKIYCIRKDSPLVVGKGENGVYIASDVQALLPHTNMVTFIKNMEIVSATKDDYKLFSIDQEPRPKLMTRIEQAENESGKDGFAHYMLKEIFEQPQVAKRVAKYYTKNGRLIDIGIKERDIQKAKQINVIACGSAYNAALVGARTIEDISGTKTKVFLASEWRYQTDTSNKNDLFVFVSQSGETADTISCLRRAKDMGRKTISIVNVFGSTLWREADVVLPVLAGPEIAVATTKAYVAQVIVFHFLALKVAKCKGKITKNKLKSCILDICRIDKQILCCLKQCKKIQQLANKIYTKSSVLFLGRGQDYDICQEANLKFKEISYIHSESYAAGELKHGSISLIEDGSICIAVATKSSLKEKLVSNLQEVKSRGAKILVFTSFCNADFSGTADHVFCIPKSSNFTQPIVSIVPLQLLSYFVALARGLDIDKPRNLAKSVTVE